MNNRTCRFEYLGEGLQRWHNIEPELTFRFQQILAQQLMLEVESTHRTIAASDD